MNKLLIMASTVLCFTCCQNNLKKFATEVDFIDSKDLVKVEPSNSIKFNMNILNNPFNISKNHKIRVMLDTFMVFDDDFLEDKKFSIYLPKELINKNVHPSVYIYKNNNSKKAFYFTPKYNFYIDSLDNYLIVSFSKNQNPWESILVSTISM